MYSFLGTIAFVFALAVPAQASQCLSLFSRFELSPTKISQLLERMNPDDKVALTLSVKNNPTKFNEIKKMLKSHGITELSAGFNVYSYRHGMNNWLQRLQIRALVQPETYQRMKIEGQGMISLFMSRDQLNQVKDIIEHVDSVRAFGRRVNETDGIVRSNRTIDEVVHPSHLAEWNKLQKTDLVDVFILTRHSESDFAAFEKSLQNNSEIQILRAGSYNDVQSWGGVVLRAPRQVLERLAPQNLAIETIQINRK